MKKFAVIGLASALCLSASALQAQDAVSVSELQKQLREMQQEMKALRQEVQDLRGQDKARSLMKGAVTPQGAAAPLTTSAGVTLPAPSAGTQLSKPWSPADPIRVLGGQQSYMNISLDGLFAAGSSTAKDIEGGTQLGGHDPKQRGFTVQNLELTLDGKVDPYFRGQANVVLQIDPQGETTLELEEAFMESSSLPANLQLKAGQYFTEFGRLNPQHPHSWAFVDQPLVNGRFFGGDGLRNAGARLSWLTPTPFYSELFFNVQNSHGETATSFRSEGFEGPHPLPFAFRPFENDRGVKNFDDLLLSARYAMSFDLTDTQTLLAGASAAFGPNSSGATGDSRTQVYGVDLFWKWKPSNHHGGFPFVSFQTEAMLRKYRTGAFDWDRNATGGDDDGDGNVDAGLLVDPATSLPAVLRGETLTDYGLYSQLLYGFRPGWVAGLRFDYVNGDRAAYEQAGLLIADGTGGSSGAGLDLFRTRRWRVSPNLTYHPSEFSKIRLQYNYDARAGLGVDHSVWLQFEFLLGAHSAHKF